MGLSRRKFFTLTGASAASVVFGSSLQNFYTKAAHGKNILNQGFGKLVRDPNGILDLPNGFQYRVISQVGETMSDGTPVPTNMDGMAAFAGAKGTTILVRNHELRPGQIPIVTAPENQKYDRLCPSGTTTLVLNRDRQIIKQNVSLAGTLRNCSGGTTPWGSWISCEENVSTTASPPKNSPDPYYGDWNQVSLKHGYNFEVPSRGDLVTPIPLKAMGRFRHEAIAIDPNTGYVYQTEDREDSCIYRFLPQQANNLQAGGILEALVLKNMPKVDTSSDLTQNEAKAIEWVRLEDVDPENDTLRYEAQSKGAAIFKRGEGMCYANGDIFWTCTNGGKAGVGQIFRYNTKAETVELFVESPGVGTLDYPDNLIMSPFGDLIVCEDGDGEQFVVGIKPNGEIYHFARNALNEKEFAGVCFSPDGQTMFVNIYDPGLTLAIWGKWR